MEIGNRLKEARARSGLTLDQISERTGIGASSLSEFENDKRAPRMHQLHALAKLYNRAVTFFLEDGPVVSARVLWRQKPVAEVAAEVESKFLLLCEQYHNLEVWCDRKRSCSLPPAEPLGGGGSDVQAAKDLARQTLRLLDLGERPGRNLLRVLEEVCGVKVFHLDFEPEGSAACIVGPFGSAVLLNARNVRWRRNFDLAHELFHLLTWKVFRKGAEAAGAGADAEPSPTEEKLAGIFASNLLLPPETTRSAIDSLARKGSLGFPDLEQVARQFDVSAEALIYQMAWLYNLGADWAPKTVAEYRAFAAWFDTRTREDDKPPQRPERFRALAIEALRKGEMATGRFAEYMGIGRTAALRYLEGLEPVEHDEIDLTPA